MQKTTKVRFDEQGREERRFLLAEQNRNFLKQETVLQQKAHPAVKWRRAKNGLNWGFENDQWHDDKEMIKDKDKDFFK